MPSCIPRFFVENPLRKTHEDSTNVHKNYLISKRFILSMLSLFHKLGFSKEKSFKIGHAIFKRPRIPFSLSIR